MDANVRELIARLQSTDTDTAAVASALAELRDLFIPSSSRNPLADDGSLAALWAVVVPVFLRARDADHRENAAPLLLPL
ncbi:hypothetical protein [Lysobacter sp. CA199]|uniref:hypothetical protein n=1 Tax=Lysobacter sp. CA199 TaxID=3455608 RepID=UPI003F8D784C